MWPEQDWGTLRPRIDPYDFESLEEEEKPSSRPDETFPIDKDIPFQ
jgi:hypothetical protein